MESYVINWKCILNKDDGKRGGNKLRTYRLFKNDFYPEPYVISDMPRCYRSAMAKFRCGVAPIRVETGRYENIPLNERTCFNCNHNVEDEFHVLFHCDIYNDIRENLFNYCQLSVPNFYGFTSSEKMLLFQGANMFYYFAKTCFLMLRRRKCILYS